MFDAIYGFLAKWIDVFLHLDKHLNEWAAWSGDGLYVILFLIIFCETGLVVTPFLPGDSLLFALGAMTVTENAVLSFPILYFSLIIAGIIGDFVNYSIGKKYGRALFANPKSRFFKQSHLIKTENFYLKHGGKTIILARFIPIVRTFAPFVAGMGRMPYRQFGIYNVVGAIAWVSIFLVAGRIFGNIPAVKRNFQYVILGIIVVSVLPIVFEVIKARRAQKSEHASQGQAL